MPKIFTSPIVLKEKDPCTIFVLNETDFKLYFILEKNLETNIATLYVATDQKKFKEKIPKLASNPADAIEAGEVEIIAPKYAGLDFIDLASFNIKVDAHEFEGHPYQAYVIDMAEPEEAPDSFVN